MHVGLVIRATRPNYGSAEAYCIPSFEINSRRFKSDISDQEAGPLDVCDDSSIYSIVMDGIASNQRIESGSFNSRFKRRLPQRQHFVAETHGYKRKLPREWSICN